MSADRGPGQNGAGEREESQPTESTPAAAGDATAAALGRARAAARAQGLSPRSGPQRSRRRGSTQIPGTGPGFPAEPAGREPQNIGSALSRVVAEHGWQAPAAIGAVFGRWPEVVGADIADHCEPETFVDGRLVLRASSTAWATQLKLLLGQLERRIAAEVGEGVVTEITVLGPGAPTWKRGPRSVPGRGPRDTYG